MIETSVEPGIDISAYSIAQIRDLQSGEGKLPEKAKTETSEVAAETPAAESIVAASDPAKTEETEAEKEISEPTPKGKGLQKRFSTLTKTIRDLEAKLAAKPPAAPEVKQAVATPEPVKELTAPKQEDFTSWEDYADARVEYKIKLAKADEAQAAQVATAKAEQSALESRLTKQTSEARVKHADFDAVALNPQLPVTQVMLHVLQSSDNGAELLYHLGQNPELSAKIAALSPGSAALAIGKLEAKLFPEDAPEPVAPKTETTKVLPKPVSTVGAVTATPKASLNDMEYGPEWKTLYAKQRSKR